jgi:hypothetical protein
MSAFVDVDDPVKIARLCHKPPRAEMTAPSGSKGAMPILIITMGGLNNQVQHLSGRVLRWEPTTSI